MATSAPRAVVFDAPVGVLVTLTATRELTRGSIASQIVWFALPLLASSVIQLLYSTVDLLFVGRFLGTGAAAAVGASGLIATCLIGLATGLSSGAGVLAARHFGAGTKAPVATAIHTSLAFGALVGIVLTVVCVTWADVFLSWLDVPTALVPQAGAYLRLYAVGITSTLVFNMAAALLRALGDSASPMISQLFGGFGNVVANILFIVVLNLGIEGAAMATVASQSFAAVLVLRRLHALEPDLRLQRRRLRISGPTLRAMLHVGLPASIQAVVITFSNLVVQHRINELGVAEIAGYAVWFRVENLCYFPAMALGQAAAIFVAQNVGAGQPGRARRGVATCLGITAGTQVALCAVFYPASGYLFSLFLTDLRVIAVGIAIARTILPWYLLFGVMEVLSSTLRGAGHPIAPMVIILVALCGGRAVLLGLFGEVFNSAALVAQVYPITWAVTVAGLATYCYLVRDSLWHMVPPAHPCTRTSPGSHS